MLQHSIAFRFQEVQIQIVTFKLLQPKVPSHRDKMPTDFIPSEFLFVHVPFCKRLRFSPWIDTKP